MDLQVSQHIVTVGVLSSWRRISSFSMLSISDYSKAVVLLQFSVFTHCVRICHGYERRHEQPKDTVERFKIKAGRHDHATCTSKLKYCYLTFF